MMRVFADTNYWIALLNPQDGLHARAAEASERFRPSDIVTSDMVLTEVLNSFSDAGPHLRRGAAKLTEALWESSVTVHPFTRDLIEQALARYDSSGDKSWSLTDCASFYVMEQGGIRAALTYDRHFIQAGYEALLR
jgi:predicted nucleic acid-binding protein